MSPPQYVGYIGALVAIVFFGSNFVPVKKFNSGDGVFFQWVMCVGIWMVGLFANIVRHNPIYHPFVIVGGMIWVCGNLCAVPVINCIGLGLGLAIWGCTNMVVGWAGGRFGLFGTLNPDYVESPALNYAGLAGVIVSLVLFAMIKPDESQLPAKSSVAELDPLLAPVRYAASPTEQSAFTLNADGFPVPQSDADETQNFFTRLPPVRRRILGIGLALLSGVFYASMFDPPQILIDHHCTVVVPEQFQPNKTTRRQCFFATEAWKDDAEHWTLDEDQWGTKSVCCHGFSPIAVDYAFAQFSGILLMSTFAMVVYALVSKNRPFAPAQLIAPSFLSGIMWGVAQMGFLLANSVLSFAVSFPLIGSGPGLVGLLWGIIVFKEIRSRKNLLTVAVGLLILIGSLHDVRTSSAFTFDAAPRRRHDDRLFQGQRAC